MQNWLSNPHLGLTPEDLFLLSAARWNSPDSASISRLIQICEMREFSWEHLFTVAQAAWVHPQVGHCVLQNVRLRERLPQAVADNFQLAAFVAQSRWQRYVDTLQSLLTRLADVGAPALLLKGAAFTASQVPASRRLLNDFDLLIEEKHYSTARAALIGSGYRIDPKAEFIGKEDAEASQLSRFHEIGFLREEQPAPLSVDLHLLLFQRASPFAANTRELVSRAIPVEVGTASALATSLEDSFINLSVQLADDDLRCPLSRLVDLHAIAVQLTSYELLLKLAKEMHATGPVLLGLALSTALGVDVPEDLLVLDGRLRSTWLRMIAAVRDPGCVLGKKRLRASALAVFLPCLYSARSDRRRYWLQFPANAFAKDRREGCSLPQAAWRTARATAAAAAYGVTRSGVAHHRDSSQKFSDV